MNGQAIGASRGASLSPKDIPGPDTLLNLMRRQEETRRVLRADRVRELERMLCELDEAERTDPEAWKYVPEERLRLMLLLEGVKAGERG